jgi:hypothetical protein
MFDYNDSTVTTLDKVFEATVPSIGKAATLGGEYVRAVERIAYRWTNDGDQIGCGYGCETCNAAGRFLLAYGSDTTLDVIWKMWGAYLTDDAYDLCLQNLMRSVANDLDSHPEWFGRTDHPDMWDLRADADTEWDDEWDDDDWDDEEW